MGWFGLALMAALLALTLYDGTNLAHLAFASGVALFSAVIAVVYVRPGLTLHADHLLVRNALSDVSIPWRLIESITVRHVMEIDVGEKVVPALAFGRSVRQQRQYAATPSKLGEMDYTDHVVDKVRDAVRQHARVTAPDDDRDAVACWRWPDIAVLAVLTLLTASLIVLA
jgi:hypothetical protein